MESSTQRMIERVEPVPVDMIDISGKNPRKVIKDEKFNEFKASIKEKTLIEPILIRPSVDDRYELVVGERRLTAVKDLKQKTILSRIKVMGDQEALETMLIENLQRTDLTALEEAAAIEELLKDTGNGGMTQEEVAKKLGKSQPWVANRLRLLKAPDKLKEYLISGQMTPQHLISLLPYCDKEGLIGQVLRKYDDKRKYGDGCSVEELQGYVESILLYDDAGRFAFRPDLDDMGYKMKQLAKSMDLSACENCKKAVMVEEGDEGEKKTKVRVCLETDCFRPKVNEARKKIKDRDKAYQEREKKAGRTSTSNLRYGVDYVDMHRSSIPFEWCKRCPQMQNASGAQMTLSGARSHETICRRPSCYQERRDYYHKQATILVKRICAAVESAQKAYMRSRPAGLKQHELQFIIGQLIDDRITRKQSKIGGMKEKQLEEYLLGAAITHASRTLGYEIHERAPIILSKLPFKLEGDFSLPPPPQPEVEPEIEVTKDMDSALKEAIEEQSNKKKVQEKRKKKGA